MAKPVAKDVKLTLNTALYYVRSKIYFNLVSFCAYELKSSIGRVYICIDLIRKSTYAGGTTAEPLLLVTNSLVSNSWFVQHPMCFNHKSDMLDLPGASKFYS